MKKSKKFWTIVSVILILIGYFTGFLFIKAAIYNEEEQTYCGTIVYKSADEVTIKYGTKTELYLGFKNDKIGTRAILVTPHTYLSTEVGENVCFDLENHFVYGRMMENGWDMLKYVFFGMWALASFGITVWFLIEKGIEANENFNRYLDGEE